MIIGVCGLIGSGKDTIAEHLIKDHKFHKTSFADKLKDAVGSMFDWDRDMLEGKTEPSRQWREQSDSFWTAEAGFEVSPRYLLQRFGTECMREGFFDGIWVSLTKKKILDNPDINWVVPDVRFPNEIKMIKSIGGHIWRVQRGNDPDWVHDYVEGNLEPIGVHPSEWRWLNEPYDALIKNNDTISALQEDVDSLLGL
tara:strand:- start:963 stop:1553 length:591 start_codon:yes stop_codon:yes gene_type:complete